MKIPFQRCIKHLDPRSVRLEMGKNVQELPARMGFEPTPHQNFRWGLALLPTRPQSQLTLLVEKVSIYNAKHSSLALPIILATEDIPS